MASTSASYRKPEPALTLEVRPEQIPSSSVACVARDLEALCAMGMLEAFVDMYGIVRYRPSNKAQERAA